MRAHLTRVDAVIVQAVIAGALSFSHLHDLASAAGQGGWKAWAYPVSVDLLLVAAWRRMRQAQRAGQAAGDRDCGSWWPWPPPWAPTSPPPGSSTSTTSPPRSASSSRAGPPSPSSAARFAHTPHGDTEAPAVPDSSAPSTDAHEERPPAPAAVDTTDRDALPAPSTDPEPAPESAAEPVATSTPVPAPVPAVALPPALVDRVRALADEHHSATGRPADPDAVRARLGLPPSMTASVAAHL
ncbi:DUF2637 domain-containing protein [Streptomyces sp. KM77-8]|uniref:DUF2637 domain-containing protein n=1 Tax=Streptomyces haneummycinicus TaxID=3074435 RepID=A0AAT9H9C2_9ACTN